MDKNIIKIFLKWILSIFVIGISLTALLCLSLFSIKILFEFNPYSFSFLGLFLILSFVLGFFVIWIWKIIYDFYAGAEK